MRRRVGWLIVPFCWALACGGRFEKTTQQGDDDDDVGGVSTGQGGSVQPKAGSAELVAGCRRLGRRVGRGRTGVVTVSTGEASLIADLAPRTGIDLPDVPAATRDRLL